MERANFFPDFPRKTREQYHWPNGTCQRDVPRKEAESVPPPGLTSAIHDLTRNSPTSPGYSIPRRPRTQIDEVNFNETPEF